MVSASNSVQWVQNIMYRETVQRLETLRSKSKTKTVSATDAVSLIRSGDTVATGAVSYTHLTLPTILRV